MSRTIQSIAIVVWLLTVTGCRINRHLSTDSHTQLEVNREGTLSHVVDSLYRCNLSGEIEWMCEHILYSPDTLCDTPVVQKSVTRWRQSVRVAHQQQKRVVDTLSTTQSYTVRQETESSTRERKSCSTLNVIPAIALILILLLIYKLFCK